MQVSFSLGKSKDDIAIIVCNTFVYTIHPPWFKGQTNATALKLSVNSNGDFFLGKTKSVKWEF